MARVFRGQGRHKVDGKGRVSVPANFRRVLEASDPDWTDGLQPNLVIHYGTAKRFGYLECYTMEAIDEVDAKIGALKRGTKDRRMMEAYFSAQTHPVVVDDNGRMLIPNWIREKIGLEGDALFVAAHDTFHIWNPETYEGEVEPQTEAQLDELPEDMDPLVLLDGGGV
ncbi:division/cell wall cluster transcriptional repressor MraZ [Tropicimonas sp. TH_r6]|uniref:division/cell wall cluster transcriptional repressor MraZ n=1 Tax=Tropicimonas sp. TH_r6 TaxID=3082085 RepID=UPI00295433BA|nr:division/cell wall cluster transcriptional repressor MraZ [Tropicimonas sp. TH_r6]MDV7142623.1 division/cell wall cluster transcriptional repressor MraZ [Tropicimonas sp. TH_r6]